MSMILKIHYSRCYDAATSFSSVLTLVTCAVAHRSYEDTHGCSAAIIFCVKQIDEGDKKLKTTDVLLRLEHREKVKEIIASYQELTQGQDGSRASLTEVVTKEQMNNFKCCFWGDVSRSMKIARVTSKYSI